MYFLSLFFFRNAMTDEALLKLSKEKISVLELEKALQLTSCTFYSNNTDY